MNAARPARPLLMAAAAFLAWLFAGLENALFLLVHRDMVLSLLGPETPEQTVTQWFALFQSAFLLGAASGGWLFGRLGDRSGRTRALGWSVVCYSVLTLAGWMATDIRLMWILRFLAMLGFGGTWPNAMALMTESWPRVSRPLMAGVMGSAANFGMVLMALLALWEPISTDSWRWTMLVGGLPLIPGLLTLCLVPESPLWQQARRQRSTATAAASGTGRLFQKALLRSTLLGIALGAVPVIGTAANANWVIPWTDHFNAQHPQPEAASTPGAQQKKPDKGAKARAQIQRSGGGIIGSFLGGVLAMVAGRRLSYFLISLCSLAMSSLLFAGMTPHDPWFGTVNFLLGFFGVTYFGWLPLFLPELFPTEVRATGAGLCFNSGRIAAAAVVLFAAFGMTQFQGDYGALGFWSGLIYVAGMALIWQVPGAPQETQPQRVFRAAGGAS